MHHILLLLLLASVTDGDRQWAMRAAGSTGGRAVAGPIDAAIAAYEQAVAQDPNALEPRWKLMRALRFKGAYVARTSEEKKTVYSKAKDVGEAAIDLLYRRLQLPKNAPEKSVAAAARKVQGAGQILVWDAVNWGEWALAYGKMAAARQGAADRIRRNATIAHLIDPTLEGGTPSRVLGRLHDQTPRIPFITGWASGKEAVRYLAESLKVDPTNKISMVFFAEALVEETSGSEARAIKLLEDAIAAPNDPEYLVEQAAATEDARRLLDALR
jgi:tetratricopeptide (TPR) repeat protein